MKWFRHCAFEPQDALNGGLVPLNPFDVPALSLLPLAMDVSEPAGELLAGRYQGRAKDLILSITKTVAISQDAEANRKF